MRMVVHGFGARGRGKRVARSFRWCAAALAAPLLAAPLLDACHVADPAPPAERTGDVADPLMSAGMERVIPLRWIQILDCQPGPGCPDIVSHEAILANVQNANQIYRTLGGVPSASVRDPGGPVRLAS